MHTTTMITESMNICECRDFQMEFQSIALLFAGRKNKRFYLAMHCRPLSGTRDIKAKIHAIPFNKKRNYLLFGSNAIYMKSIHDAWSWICINARIAYENEREEEWKRFYGISFNHHVLNVIEVNIWNSSCNIIRTITQFYSNKFVLLYHRRFPFNVLFVSFITSFHSFFGQMC